MPPSEAVTFYLHHKEGVEQGSKDRINKVLAAYCRILKRAAKKELTEGNGIRTAIQKEKRPGEEAAWGREYHTEGDI